MWKPTTSSSTASSSDNKQNIKEVVGVDDCKYSGVEQQKQENNSNDPLNLTGETSDSGFISGPHTTSSINIESEQQQQGEGAGAVGVSGGDIKTLNIPRSLSEPQLQKHHQHHNLKYQEKQQQQQDIDSDYLDIDSEHLQPKSQQHFDTDSGCIEEGDMKFKHNVDAGLPGRVCSSSVVASRLSNLYALQKKNQRLCQKLSTAYFSSFASVPTQISSANPWAKYFQQNNAGNTHFHLECYSGNVAAVTILIRMAPRPSLFNIQNYRKYTPLHYATMSAKLKIIRLLLTAGAERTAVNHEGNTALHLACKSGNEQCVLTLTVPIRASERKETYRQIGHRDFGHRAGAYLPSDMDIRNHKGQQCVHIAAESGFISILRILIFYGANVNARQFPGGRTLLQNAIFWRNKDLVNFLLDECRNLNLETPSWTGLTAYQYACILNESEIQNMLEKKGAEPLMPPHRLLDDISDSETDTDTDSDSISCYDSSDSEMDPDSDSSSSSSYDSSDSGINLNH